MLQILLYLSTSVWDPNASTSYYQNYYLGQIGREGGAYSFNVYRDPDETLDRRCWNVCGGYWPITKDASGRLKDPPWRTNTLVAATACDPSVDCGDIDMTCTIQQWLTDFVASPHTCYAGTTGEWLHFCACPIARLDEIFSIADDTDRDYVWRAQTQAIVFPTSFEQPVDTGIVGNQQLQFHFILATDDCDGGVPISGSECDLAYENGIQRCDINITNMTISNDTAMNGCYRAYHTSDGIGGEEWTNWRDIGNDLGELVSTIPYQLYTEPVEPAAVEFIRVDPTTYNFESNVNEQTVSFYTKGGETLNYTIGFFQGASVTCSGIGGGAFGCNITEIYLNADAEYDISTCEDNLDIASDVSADLFTACWANATGGTWYAFTDTTNDVISVTAGPPGPAPSSPPTTAPPTYVDIPQAVRYILNETATATATVSFAPKFQMGGYFEDINIGLFSTASDGTPHCNDTTVNRTTHPADDDCGDDGTAQCICTINLVGDGDIGTCDSMTVRGEGTYTACYANDTDWWRPFNDTTWNVLTVASAPTPSPTYSPEWVERWQNTHVVTGYNQKLEVVIDQSPIDPDFIQIGLFTFDPDSAVNPCPPGAVYNASCVLDTYEPGGGDTLGSCTTTLSEYLVGSTPGSGDWMRYRGCYANQSNVWHRFAEGHTLSADIITVTYEDPATPTPTPAGGTPSPTPTPSGPWVESFVTTAIGDTDTTFIVLIDDLPHVHPPIAVKLIEMSSSGCTSGTPVAQCDVTKFEEFLPNWHGECTDLTPSPVEVGEYYGCYLDDEGVWQSFHDSTSTLTVVDITIPPVPSPTPTPPTPTPPPVPTPPPTTATDGSDDANAAFVLAVIASSVTLVLGVGVAIVVMVTVNHVIGPLRPLPRRMSPDEVTFRMDPTEHRDLRL